MEKNMWKSFTCGVACQARSLSFAALAVCAAFLFTDCSDKKEVSIPVVPIETKRDTVDVEIEMVLIPAGTFRMGNITGYPEGSFREKPVHDVTITRAFLMGVTEVTQAQYEAVTWSNPSYFKGPDLPVAGVYWHEAVRFCNELSRRHGFDTCYTRVDYEYVCDFNANGYRLPTEAEWEYACRAGTETDFYTGNLTQPDHFSLDSALDRAAWYAANSGYKSHPVALKEPNAFGLYDMHGNVTEWCWDYYGRAYYTADPVVDPRGPAASRERVFRGGSWAGKPYTLRSSYRFSPTPADRNPNMGFRVVRTY
jgi:formylglycine-generating enzyme